MEPQTFALKSIPSAVVSVAIGSQSYLHSCNLSTSIKFDQQDMPLRDLIRSAFAELGIEVEYSGRDENEKGVIIDIDEERLTALGLNADALRFGQTVVRVDSNYAQVAKIIFDKAIMAGWKLDPQTNYSPDMLIREMMGAALLSA